MQPDGTDLWPHTQPEFGEALRLAREAAKLSRAALARATDIPEATLQSTERGKHSTTPERRARLWTAIQTADQHREQEAPARVPRCLVIDLSGLSESEAAEALEVLQAALAAYERDRDAPAAMVRRRFGADLESDAPRYAHELDAEFLRDRVVRLLRPRLASARVE